MRPVPDQLAKLTMRLSDCASVIRSKNAGPFEVTIDVMFDTDDAFAAAQRSGLTDTENLAALLRVEPPAILDVIAYAPARAIKINLARDVSSGTVGDRDVYGTQWFVPLLDLEIPVEKGMTSATR